MTTRPLSLASRLKQAGGFTIAEMLLVVAVMAILISMSTPAIYKFMQQRDVQNEENALAQIHKAMEAYIADKGDLPLDTDTTWATKLAAYTNLSADEIDTDTWGHPRMYNMYPSTGRTIMGTTVPVYYATVFSMGGNNKAENRDPKNAVIPGIAVAGNPAKFSASTAATWWSRLGAGATMDQTRVNAFAALRPGGDDQMTRFTDYSAKLDAYNQTLDRLDRLGQALETYARSGYAQQTAYCASNPTGTNCAAGMPEKLIYYPRTTMSGDSAAYYVTTTYNTATATNITRRNEMVKVMRLLGLPDDFCCSALDTFVYSGTTYTMPFYYFSNPRPRSSTGACGTRPTTATTKLPARITTVNNSATCG